MILYLVSYEPDINASPDHYHRVEAALGLRGAHRVLYSQWAVRSNGTAQTLCDYLVTMIDPHDRILVNEIPTNHAGHNLIADLKL